MFNPLVGLVYHLSEIIITNMQQRGTKRVWVSRWRPDRCVVPIDVCQQQSLKSPATFKFGIFAALIAFCMDKSSSIRSSALPLGEGVKRAAVKGFVIIDFKFCPHNFTVGIKLINFRGYISIMHRDVHTSTMPVSVFTKDLIGWWKYLTGVHSRFEMGFVSTDYIWAFPLNQFDKFSPFSCVP